MTDDAHILPRYRRTNPLHHLHHDLTEHTRLIDPTTPAGKRALRGIPVVGGTTGTQPGTDPLHALLDQHCNCGNTKHPNHRTCRTCT